jgi:RNA polymerase sigma-70 factor (ECF subfamily)
VKIVRTRPAPSASPDAASRASLRLVDRPPGSLAALAGTTADLPSWRGRPREREMQAEDIRFATLYETWFFDVVRWIGVLGMPASDTEDLAQEVFLVVRRKLSTFDGGNEAGWLYRITELTVRDHRRRAWFKNLFVRRRRDIDLETFAHADVSPARAYEQHEDQIALQAILAKMSKKRRATFMLFEIEGCSGEEIAAIQDVPLGTVWTRLHHARKEFWKLVAELRHKEGDSR